MVIMMLITLAALLHDIGKFYQRTNLPVDIRPFKGYLVKKQNRYYYQHAAYTALFISTYIDKKWQEFLDLASSHHANKLTIVKKADIIASSHDRRDSDYQDEGDENLITKRLYSIFNEIKLDSVPYLQMVKIDELDHFYGFIAKSKQNYQDAYINYQKLFCKMCKEITNIGYNTYESLHHWLYSILANYTFAIPANTYHSDFPTVGLFDHLKLTTAIANCLEKSQFTKPFVIVKYKLKGISQYVFYDDDLDQINKRSIMVNLLSDFICYKIIDAFGLTYENVLYSLSGQGRLLLYHTRDLKTKLNQVFREISSFVNHWFWGIIAFVLSYDIYDEKKLKQGTFKNQIDDNEKYVFENERIKFTGIKEKVELPVNFETYVFDYHHHDWQNVKTLNFEPFGKIVLSPQVLIDDCYYFTVNYHRLGDIKYFSNLNKLQSKSNLGLIMMDIDKLRMVFKNGIANSKQSISKFLTLSRYLEIFFGKIVKQIVQEDTDINLIYSGGDNIIIITPINNTSNICHRINNFFYDYIGNNQTIKLKFAYEVINDSLSESYRKIKEKLKKGGE